MAKETAEQKLLKIIESTEAKENEATGDADPAAQQVADSVKGTGATTVAIPPILLNLIALIKGQLNADKPQAAFGLREVNRILMFAIIMVSLMFVMDFIKGVKYSRTKITFDVNQEEMNHPELEFPSFMEIADYLADLASRNIFQPYEEIVEEVAEEMAEDIKMIARMTEDLKLVGVSWLDTPESASALIENTTSGMTYFLKIGEKINNVNVEEIFADSVILTYDGEELELSL